MMRSSQIQISRPRIYTVLNPTFLDLYLDLLESRGLGLDLAPNSFSSRRLRGFRSPRFHVFLLLIHKFLQKWSRFVFLLVFLRKNTNYDFFHGLSKQKPICPCKGSGNFVIFGIFWSILRVSFMVKCVTLFLPLSFIIIRL